MSETKKYAIRCSTQRQARECIEKGLHCFIYRRGKIIILPERYTIITYEEAVGLGLLGEKEICVKNAPTEKEEVKEESKIEELKGYDNEYQMWSMTIEKINEIIRHLNK